MLLLLRETSDMLYTVGDNISHFRATRLNYSAVANVRNRTD